MIPADAVFYAYFALTIGGVLALAAAAYFRRDLGRYLADTWWKTLVETVQVVAGVTAVAANFASAGQKDVWLRPVVTGAVCVGIWKLLQVVLDTLVKAAEGDANKLMKAAEGDAKEKLAEYQRQVDNFSRLLAALKTLVAEDVERSTKVVKARGGRAPRLSQVRQALTSMPHLQDLLDGIARFFVTQLPLAERSRYGFRVGVYVEVEGLMTPLHGVSTRNPVYNPFTSFGEEAHRERFKLGAADPSEIVKVLQDTVRTRVIEDCEAEELAGTFKYFNPQQRAYLQSMVSHAIGLVCLGDGRMGQAVLTVDTDARGFFPKADRDAIELSLIEFAERIKLEMLLHVLVDNKGPSNEGKTRPGGAGKEAGGPPGTPPGGANQGDG